LDRARNFDFNKNASDLFDPKTNVFYMCKYIEHIEDVLILSLDRKPTDCEIVCSYRMGHDATLVSVIQWATRQRRIGEPTDGTDAPPFAPEYWAQWQSANARWELALAAVKE
jgi:hypothetical protein